VAATNVSQRVGRWIQVALAKPNEGRLNFVKEGSNVAWRFATTLNSKQQK